MPTASPSDALAWAVHPQLAPARTTVGVDPGVEGGAALLLDSGQLAWVASWRPHHRPTPEAALVLDVLEPMTGRRLRFNEPHLWGCLSRLPTPEGARCTVEGLFIPPHPQVGLDVLLEAAGMALAWAHSRRLDVTSRPRASRWRADLLAPPPRAKAGEIDALIAAVFGGAPVKGARVIAHGLQGDVSGLSGHAHDAIALAAWGSGRRLTAVENRATKNARSEP